MNTKPKGGRQAGLENVCVPYELELVWLWSINAFSGLWARTGPSQPAHAQKGRCLLRSAGHTYTLEYDTGVSSQGEWDSNWSYADE